MLKKTVFYAVAEAASNISESAVSEAGQQATSSEGATSPQISNIEDMGMDLQSMDYLDPKDVGIQAACAFSTARCRRSYFNCDHFSSV